MRKFFPVEDLARDERFHQIGRRILGRQEQHWQVRVGGAQAGQHRHPIQPRHHAVEDHEVGGILAGLCQARLTRGGCHDGVALVGQSPPQQVGYGRIVIDDQNFLIARFQIVSIIAELLARAWHDRVARHRRRHGLPLLRHAGRTGCVHRRAQSW